MVKCEADLQRAFVSEAHGQWGYQFAEEELCAARALEVAPPLERGVVNLGGLRSRDFLQELLFRSLACCLLRGVRMLLKVAV